MLWSFFCIWRPVASSAPKVPPLQKLSVLGWGQKTNMHLRSGNYNFFCNERPLSKVLVEQHPLNFTRQGGTATLVAIEVRKGVSKLGPCLEDD